MRTFLKVFVSYLLINTCIFYFSFCPIQTQAQKLDSLINLYVKDGKAKAEKYFKKAVKIAPKSANTWDSLGEYYEKTNNLKQTKIAYEKAVTLSKKHQLENQKLYIKNCISKT